MGCREAAKNAFKALPANRVHSLKSSLYLAPGVGITGPVPRLNSYEDTGGTFHLDAQRRSRG